MTDLTLYGSSVASTTLATAAQLASVSGGTETFVTTTGPSSGDGYAEIRGLAGSSPLNASISAPTGNGFLWDTPDLEGQTIAAGIWTASIGLADAAGSGPTLSFTVRAFQRSSAGVYTLIGPMILGASTIFRTRTTYTLTSAVLSSMDFGSGDKLYFDEWIQANGWGSDPIENFVSTSATQGLANDLQIIPPGYGPTALSPLPWVIVPTVFRSGEVQANYRSGEQTATYRSGLAIPGGR